MNTTNKIAKALFVIGIAEIALCLVFGMIAGQPEHSFEDYNITVMLIWWVGGFISGMFIIGFAEVIRLLQDISDKKTKSMKETTYSESLNNNDSSISVDERNKNHLMQDGYRLSFESKEDSFNASLTYTENGFAIVDFNDKLVHAFNTHNIVDFKYDDSVLTIELIIKDIFYSYKVTNINESKDDVTQIYNLLKNIFEVN